MGDPGVEAVLVEELEVCTDHGVLGVGAVVVADYAVEIAAVIVAEFVGASGFAYQQRVRTYG